MINDQVVDRRAMSQTVAYVDFRKGGINYQQKSCAKTNIILGGYSTGIHIINES